MEEGEVKNNIPAAAAALESEAGGPWIHAALSQQEENKTKERRITTNKRRGNKDRR